jgi:hypothetical protein
MKTKLCLLNGLIHQLDYPHNLFKSGICLICESRTPSEYENHATECLVMRLRCVRVSYDAITDIYSFWQCSSILAGIQSLFRSSERIPAGIRVYINLDSSRRWNQRSALSLRCLVIRRIYIVGRYCG